MNNNGNPIIIERNVTLATEKILKQSEKLPTTEEKIAYLKKIINDCDRIINLAKKLDGKNLDVNLLKKTEQNIDENLILFLEGLCKPTLSLPNGQAGMLTREHEKTPLVLRQPRKYYKVSLTDGDKVCDIQIAFGGVQSFKESIRDQITVIEAEGKNEEMTAVNAERELIWWKGTEPQMIYFFELLFDANLLDKTQYDIRFSLIEKHFKNKKGNQFNNLQLSSANQSMTLNKTGKPKEKDAESIEFVLKDIRDLLKDLK